MWLPASVTLAWFILTIVTKQLGKRLERMRGNDFISLWLVEIGSDVRIYGWLTCTIFYISILLDFYVKNVVIVRIVTFTMLTTIGVWVLMIGVAGIVQLEDYSKRIIQDSTEILPIDKRNFLTLIPIAMSTIKLIAYMLFATYIMHILNIDVRPILNIGGIFLAALTFAGADTVKSFLATIKIFLTRRYYVGSRVKINSFKAGVVSRITIVDTTITTDAGEQQIIENSEIKTIVILKDLDKGH